MQGWISLHRKVKEHPLFREKRRFSKFEAWIDLLLTANYRQNKFLLGSQLLDVNPGSLVTSMKDLADRWGWSRTKIKSFLDLLQEDEMIIHESTSKYTTIHILKYSKYQGQEEVVVEEKTSERHEKSTNNKGNKENKDNNKNQNKHPSDMTVDAAAEILMDENIKGAQSDKTGNGSYSHDFQELWKCYPRKVDKGKAYGAYQQRLKEGYSMLQLLKAVVAYQQSVKREQREGRYIKHCSTFFGKDKPFLDYLEGGKDHGSHGKSPEKSENPYDGIGITL